MKRYLLLVLMSLLSACSQPTGTGFSTARPGVNVARAALEGGSPALALTVTDGILADQPDNAPALLTRAEALTRLGRFDEADTSYAKALAADPRSIDAMLGLGRLRLRTEPARAQIVFLGVLSREPHNVAALNNLGIAYDLQGNHAAAQATYRQVLGLEPTRRATEVNLALSMALSGQAVDAVKILRPLATQSDASPRMRQDLAAALILAGDKDGAASILSRDLPPDQVSNVLHAFEALGT